MLKDVVTSKTYPLKSFVNPNYQGLNIFNAEFDMLRLREKNNLKNCLNLIITPKKGIENKTIFSGLVFIPKEQMQNVSKSLYVRKTGSTEKVDISSSLNISDESLSFKYMITQSLMQQNGFGIKYPVSLEFIVGLKDNNSSEAEKLIISPISIVDPSTKIEENNNTKIDEIKNIDANKSSNTTMTNQDIIQSATLVENIIKNSNIKFPNITNTYTPMKVSSDGKLTARKKIKCDDNYCNNQGKCSYADKYETTGVCTCNKGYSGFYCEMTEQEKNIIKTYILNSINSIEKSLKSEEIKKDYNTGATTVSKSPKEISSSLIKAVEIHIKNGCKTIDNLEDAKKLNNIVKLILDNKNSASTENIVKSKNEIANMVSNMFDFTSGQIMKTKTIEAKKRINNNNRLLFLSEISQEEKNSENFRNLQTNLTSQEIYNQKIKLIEESENTKNLLEKMGQNFAQHFNNKYSQILKANNNTSNSYTILKSQNMSDFIFEKENNHFSLMFTPIIDINDFDFIKYFNKRVKNNQSYIDPKKCLSSKINSNIFRSEKRVEDATLNNVIFALFVNYYKPVYAISDELLKRAVSNTHNLLLFDIKGRPIDLHSCTDEIMHFIPLEPRDPEFIESYNANPTKYQLFKEDLDNNIISINQVNKKSYMPIYISPNGTIDKNLAIKQQIETYYPTYKFYLSDYNVRNVTHYNTTIEINKMFKNLPEDSVRYIKNSQIVAASRNLGNMAVMTYYDPPKDVVDKYYFLKNDNVIKRSENWNGNWCFITLTIIFGINFIFLIISFVLECSNKSLIQKDEEYLKPDRVKFEHEHYLAKTDDLIFDKDLKILRNNIYGYLYFGESNSNPIRPLKTEVSSFPQNNSNSNNNIPPNKQEIELNNINVDLKEDINRKNNTEANLKENKTNIKSYKRPETNSLIHFIFKRNIYANLFLLSSPFDPSWKFLTKFFTLIYFNLFSCTCFFIYMDIDFDPKEIIHYGPIASTIFLSILIANLAFTIVNLFYSSMINRSRIDELISSDFNYLKMNVMRKINYIKFACLLVISLLTFGGTFYLSFCLYAVYNFYGNQLIITWFLTLAFDFIVIEIFMEIFIALLLLCKGNCFIDAILNSMIAIKNLRNAN